MGGSPVACFGKEHIVNNSAIIRIDKTPLCIFTRWYGTFADIVAFACYAKLKNFGTPDIDPSGITSLLQVMANCGDGGFGLEVMPYEDAKGRETDNGTFVLEQWDVIDIQGNRGTNHKIDDDIIERIIRIDACQPESFQIGDGFIRDIASREATFSGELAVGDVIWDRGEGSVPVRATVVGFGDSGYPYVHVDADPSSPNGKPQVPDHYAREHFGKFLGNSTWFARIPELSHPQATASAFRGRPAENNLPGQINLSAPAVEAAEESYESPVVFPELAADDVPALDDVEVADAVPALQDLVSGIGDDAPFQDAPSQGVDDLQVADDPALGFDDIDEPAYDADADAGNLAGGIVDDLMGGFRNMPQADAARQDIEETVAEPAAQPVASPFGFDGDADDFSDLDEAFDDDLSDTGLIQMVTERGIEEDEFSITNELVIPTDATPSTGDIRISEIISDIAGEGDEHLVMTNANENTSELTIVQPLPQDDEAIAAVTMQAPSDTAGRSVIIPLESYEIEPDLSTDEVAKNPKPYPDVLDADFEPYEDE